MNRLRKWAAGLSVKRKLIYYSYLIIAPILVGLSLLLLYRNYTSEKSKHLNNNMDSVETLAGSVNILQTDIKDFSTYIAVNDDFMRLMKSDQVEELSSRALVWRENTPIDMLQDMISIKGHIKTIAIYPENGITPFLRGMDGSVYLQDLEAVHESEIYQKTISSTNGMLWADVDEGVGTVYESSNSEKVVFCREVYNLAKSVRLCYIVIGIQGEYFDSLCSNLLQNEQEGVMLLDLNGELLSEEGTIQESVRNYLLSDEFLSQNHRAGTTSFTVDGYDVICSLADKNGTMACKILPRYSFSSMTRDYIYTPLILLGVTLIGILPILLIISNVIVNPLKRLNEAISNLAQGDFTQQVEVTTQDEIGEVAECFNKMVKDIQRLIDENYVITLKEKESELQALQAQINPHFLYNTLDSLYWQAIDADNEEIAESILALSDLFRLVLNSGQKEVTAEVELTLVERYLQIQQARFSRKLQYEITLEDEARQVLIPKLIVQPFVENAVVHGFEDMTGNCRVSVQAHLIKPENVSGKSAKASVAAYGDLQKIGRLQIVVEDTGAGMSPEQLAGLWEKEEDVKYRRQRIGRYAIHNIRERLQLKYHDDFTLEISSEVGRGTRVVLEIPAWIRTDDIL